MPDARADEFRRGADKLGFQQIRQVGSHERWRHGGRDIGPPLFYRILRQMGIDQKRFEDLQ